MNIYEEYFITIYRIFIRNTAVFININININVFWAIYLCIFLVSRTSSEIISFDTKIHGIVFCSILTIAAGSLINQFYDKEKDEIIAPFRSKIQGFLKQKYYLYLYLVFNFFSLGISVFLSWRIFVFFLVYQLCIWFYCHKLSKKLIINNLFYVLLLLYPFLGVWVYYRFFSIPMFLLGIYLFFLLLSIDIVKDLVTIKGDKLLGYKTLPLVWGQQKTYFFVKILLGINLLLCLLILIIKNLNKYSYYFILSIFLLSFILLFFDRLKKMFIINLLKILIFIGFFIILIHNFFGLSKVSFM